MAAEDELKLPEVPEAKPEDPEDVSWALSTAEAMWARGDHMEGIKWVRRAAEAASEAENDNRALELAKAAADLAGLIARRSKTDQSDAALPPAPTSSKPSPSKKPPVPSNQPPSNAPSTARSAAPPPVPKSVPPKSGRSIPPAPVPLPSKASKPPEAPVAPRPPVTSSTRPGPAPGRGILSNRPIESKKGKRRSRENLEAEAKAAAQIVDSSRAVKPAVDSDATIVGRMEDVLAKTDERARSAEEWDASPTANLAGEDVPDPPREIERKTHVGQAPPPPRPPSSTLHDPQIQTSQAIRVVVWRDASGVHIAPAGTVVSALTIDAVLVALEPTADLTAWLSHRER